MCWLGDPLSLKLLRVSALKIAGYLTESYSSGYPFLLHATAARKGFQSPNPLGAASLWWVFLPKHGNRVRGLPTARVFSGFFSLTGGSSGLRVTPFSKFIYQYRHCEPHGLNSLLLGLHRDGLFLLDPSLLGKLSNDLLWRASNVGTLFVPV